MSSSSSCLNSAFAAASFSPSSLRNLEAMGGPWVTMWRTTSWLTGAAALKSTPPPGTRPADGCRPPSSVPVWPHSRRQRTTRRAVLHPLPLRLPAHWLQKLVRRWLLRRWLLRRWLLRRWLVRRWLVRHWLVRRWLVRRWLLRGWLLRRWPLRRWLLRRCGLKEKRARHWFVRLHKTDHHRRRGRAVQQLAGEPPACTIKQGLAFRINKQFMCSQKINTQNGASYICQKKFPRKILILESKRHQAVSPARYRLTCLPIQLRAQCR